jgi:hypothetical protein
MSRVMELEGRVTFADGLHFEITVGQPPKPQAKVYCDGNPLHFEVGEPVSLEIRREARVHGGKEMKKASRKARAGAVDYIHGRGTVRVPTKSESERRLFDAPVETAVRENARALTRAPMGDLLSDTLARLSEFEGEPGRVSARKKGVKA